MNPTKKQFNKDVPENLPIGETQKADSLFILKISKNRLKKIAQIIIILIILTASLPRILNNISNTLSYVHMESQQFPVIFPTLSSVGSFAYDQTKNAFSFVVENLASVAEILYTRRLTPEEVAVISGGVENNERALPVRIIIESANIDSVILNPTETDIPSLDAALQSGVVRYPKSGLLGDNDNIYLFGHSTSYEVVRNEAYKSLNGLGNLKEGDTIKIRSANQEYVYQTTSVTMKKNSDAIVKFNTGKRTLTISTCNTLGNKEDRYVVEANYITSYPITIINTISSNDNASSQTITNNISNNSSSNTVTPTNNPPANQEHSYTEIQRVVGENTITPSNPYGKVDLTAKITEVGILNEAKTFVATTTLKTSNKIAFKFIVTNLGDKEVTNWRFSAVLPTNPFYIYQSNTQEKLGPRESIEYSLGFDKPKEGIGEIIINLDPARDIFEKNEDNNIIKKSITVISI